MMSADIPDFGKKEIPHETSVAPAVATECYTDVTSGIHTVSWTNKTDLDALGSILDGALQEAAMFEDSETHAGYLAIAKHIPRNIFVNHVLDADPFGAEHNNYAMGLVHSLLDNERDQRLVNSLWSVSYQPNESSLLEHVVEACAESDDQIPNFWIEKYGYDKAHKWQLSEHYLTTKIDASWQKGTDTDIHMRSYTEHAMQLLGDDLPKEFVMEQIPTIIGKVDDAQTVQHMVNHFYEECLNNIPTTLAGFKRVIKMGLFLLEQEDQLHVVGGEDFIRQTISDYENRLRGNGANEYSILFTRFNWDMGNDDSETPLTAAETIDRLNTLERDLITAAGDSDAGKNAAVMLRDSFLMDSFYTSLNHGELEDAWPYLECASPTSKANMLDDYLMRANIMKADYPPLDPLTEMAAPYLNYIYRFAASVRTLDIEDLNALQQLAIECADGIGDVSEEEKAVRFNCLSRAQGVIMYGSDKAEGIEVTRHLVAKLREGGADYRHIKKLALELIKAGDETELLRIRADINDSNQTEAIKLLDKWQVAQAIRYPSK